MFLFIFSFTSTKCYYSCLASFFLHPLNGFYLSLFCVFIIHSSHAAVSFSLSSSSFLSSSNYLCSCNNFFFTLLLHPSLYIISLLGHSHQNSCWDIPIKILKRKLIQILFTKLTLFQLPNFTSTSPLNPKNRTTYFNQQQPVLLCYTNQYTSATPTSTPPL